MEHQGLLRLRLKESDPGLYRCFEQSWEIALDWWLHAVDMNMGSSNSYPHLRNMEGHLDQLIKAFEELPNTTYTSRLSPTEIYVLLSAVLFHDIGRTQPQMGDKEHGEIGNEFIRKKYAHLGIPSAELARTLGRICEYHNPPRRKNDTVDSSHTLPSQDLPQVEPHIDAGKRLKLGVTVIEPYGRIREMFIAALVLLADSMDAAYTRALPEFLSELAEIGPVGRFRRHIRGVYVDAATRMIRTVLVPSDRMDGDETIIRYWVKPVERDEWEDVAIGAARNKFLDVIGVQRTPKGKYRLQCKTFSESERISTADVLCECLSNALSPATVKSYNGTWMQYNKLVEDDINVGHLHRDVFSSRTHRSLSALLSLGLVHLIPHRDLEETGVAKVAIFLPPEASLAIILGNTRENCEVLEQVKAILADEGIILCAWMIERECCLYTSLGKPTYEPILTKDFLRRVLGGMWSLSASIFGTSRFSYEDLAAHVGEPDVIRVACAARRIASITGIWRDEPPPIQTSINSWEWKVGRCTMQMGQTSGERCDLNTPNVIKENIEKLDAPDDNNRDTQRPKPQETPPVPVGRVAGLNSFRCDTDLNLKVSPVPLQRVEIRR